ncbi:uncharacterized protein PF3D7_1120000-like [Prorops nasuta]|uniref:uncharacterized protein PF3D7_1120000-like n=1 Tax=Prorops nasuta TaxID=863751 RepID=UPI0034CE7D41
MCKKKSIIGYLIELSSETKYKLGQVETRQNSSESEAKSGSNKRLKMEDIKEMKIKELKEKLKEARLAITGKKSELQERLIQRMETTKDEVDLFHSIIESDHGGSNEGLCNPENQEDTSEEEAEETEDEEQPDEEDDESDESAEREDRGDRRKRPVQQRRRMGKFTIRDVEESLSQFSGRDKYPIKIWIREFEEMRICQTVCKLRTRNNFVKLYIYAMQEIEAQGDIEIDSLLEYIINGVQNDEANKVILYNARSLKELKEAFDVYDKIKLNIKKEKRCNEFGHRVANCKQSVESKTEPTKINCVNSIDNSMIHLDKSSEQQKKKKLQSIKRTLQSSHSKSASVCKNVFCKAVFVLLHKKEIIMNFNKINELGSVIPKNIVKLNSLTENKEYDILEVDKIMTKYGIKIIVKLSVGDWMFLPGRMAKLAEDTEQLQQLQKAATAKNLIMLYKGGKYHNVEFKSKV